ncbi:MAG: hypothetical protein RBS27_01460 [Giesbergeria sp.]|jgi:hypothetical protein|nr:hypothetical protein [Giesbergeria sp.]
MPIQSSDIRLLESERMTDTTDGGGRRTNRVIPDGVAGNIFPKVSRVDSVYGRVNLRKIYPHINTADLDVYAGAHFVITDAPDNNRISVLAFSTGSDFDTRTAARDRIESYVIAGPQSRMTLYGRQLMGTQAVLAYQRVEEPLPEVGDVYSISTEVAGVTTALQFVRVQDVAHEVRTFEESAGGQFDRRVITLKIGAPLRAEFQGVAFPVRYASEALSTGKIRTTTVADAARYYGLQPLTAAVSSGALELTVASVYAPIVPTTQRETPLSLASIGGSVAMQPSAEQEVTRFFALPDSDARVVASFLPCGVKPGSFRGLTYPGLVSVDDGLGNIVREGAYGYSGTIDYATGRIAVMINTAGTGVSAQLGMTATWTPAAEVSQPAHTQAIAVTLATRGTVYSVPLMPIPAPGTTIVDFRALGKWYRLRDNGRGELVGGDAAYGTGTVDYVTGAVTVTLGALPDVGSSVLMSWGSPVHYEVLTEVPAVGFEVTLTQTPVKPGTVVLTWDEDGTAKTATDDGVGGFTGAASGTISYQTGALKVVMPTPIVGMVGVDYSQYVAPPEQPAATGLTHAFGEAIVPRSVVVFGVQYLLPNGNTYTIDLIDNGAGGLVPSFARVLGGNYELTSATVGTVDYATGAVALTEQVSVEGRGVWNPEDTHWTAAPPGEVAYVMDIVSFAATTVSSGDADAINARTQSVEVGTEGLGLSLKLGPELPNALVPGSVMFTLGGKVHIDRGGSIYTDLSATTGSGRVVGSINYDTGEVTMNDYPSGTAAGMSIQACLAVKGSFTSTSVAFRTAGSPLRPASLYVQCTAADGELLTATSDQSGVITGPLITVGPVTIPGMAGVVEQTMGVVSITFGKPVMPGTLRYSAVVLSNLPLNADILGLDPVRLPSDGRVPIFRPADVTVLHHTDIFDAGTPEAGDTISVGRTDLSALWLEDANKKKLSSSLYAVDLAAGTATMAADLDLDGYMPPIAAKHRIEEMGLLSDVQINGQLTLTAPLSRDFPAGSLLSSALLYGDLQARVTNVFDQQTWTGVWQGTVIGSGATAQYNDVDYPIEVTNDGAITERWRLNFTTATSYQVIGENLGVIGTGTTSADLQIINLLTGLPYFTLRAAGFGLGWPVGGQLRFDTIAAAPPTWLARCVLPGAALTGDSFDAQLRGDVD